MHVCSRYFRITLFQSIRGTLQSVHSFAVHARPLSADRVQVAKQLPLASMNERARDLCLREARASAGGVRKEALGYGQISPIWIEFLLSICMRKQGFSLARTDGSREVFELWPTRAAGRCACCSACSTPASRPSRTPCRCRAASG